MLPITIEQYLGPHSMSADATPEIRGRAAQLLEKVNAALLLAEQDGVRLFKNPFTGGHVGGRGNGGFRPRNSSVGAPSSRHKSAEAIDLYDPQRELATWSLNNEARLEALGIVAIEDPRWTPSWVHWQIVPVPSGRFAFVPSNTPPLAAALPGQVVA
jgi:hypothetical protein